MTRCAVFSNNQIDPVKLIADLKEEDMDEERIKAIERGLELEREKQNIRADTEAWLATFGGDEQDHGDAFRYLYTRHFKWRVEGKPWR